MRSLFTLLLAIAACSPAPSTTAVAEPATNLLGQWRIVALNDRPPVVGHDGRPLVLTFDENSYGGYAGCNGFGGQGLAAEGRFYGGYVLSTAMACGNPFDEQETGVQRLLAAAPRMNWLGPDRVTFVASGQRLELARNGPLPAEHNVTPNLPLIGTAWTFGALDGRAIEMPGSHSGPVMTVEGDRFTLETPCLAGEGGWTQTGSNAVTLNPDRRVERPCNSASRAQSEAWLAAMRGALRYGTGRNGEILLAGGGHWMAGGLARRGGSEAGSLAGRYEVEGALPAAQRNGARPAELILARNAYSLWDGCNHTEGLAIAFERQLFIHSSGMTTLANCLPGRADARLKRIVQSAPRIGRIEGGLLLASPNGDVRLRRTGNAPPGTGGVTTRLAAGMRFIFLEMSGGTLSILPGNRFRLTQTCGVTEGQWREYPDGSDGAFRFGPERPSRTCENDLAARALQRTFLGNADVAIGPNRDIALFAGRFGAVRARLER